MFFGELEVAKNALLVRTKIESTGRFHDLVLGMYIPVHYYLIYTYLPSYFVEFLSKIERNSKFVKPEMGDHGFPVLKKWHQKKLKLMDFDISKGLMHKTE